MASHIDIKKGCKMFKYQGPSQGLSIFEARMKFINTQLLCGGHRGVNLQVNLRVHGTNTAYIVFIPKTRTVPKELLWFAKKELF